MTARTCLLVSDDPDDQIEFDEALQEISSDIILVTVTDVSKAIDFLTLGQCVPAFVFLNVETDGFDPEDLLRTVAANPDLERIKFITYGEYGDHDKLPVTRITTFLNNEVNYTDLRNFLERLMKVP